MAGVDGVALAAIDPALALPACAAAVREHPGEARLALAYARALQRNGDGAAALRLYEWAAADGMAAAQYALGRMLEAGDGVPADPASAARWLAMAAAQGYAGDDSAAAPPAAVLADNPIPAATDAAVADPSDPEADRLLRLAAALDSYGADVPRLGFDLAAAAVAAGPRPEDAAAWVAAHTTLLPYRGSLRGAQGTLMDRHGNSLDRALLLAELLRRNGYTVRLARAALDPAAAEALLDAAPAPTAAPEQADSAPLAAQLAAAGLGDPDTVALLTEADASRRAADAAVAARGGALADALLAALGDSPQTADANARAAAVAALQDHWWVQVADGAAWRDADPDAGLVGAIAASETVDPAGLPAGLSHMVALTVSAEFWDRGTLREATLLAQRLPAADALGRPIVLRMVPQGLSLAALLAEPAADTTASVLSAFADAWIWQPELSIGGTVLTDRLLTTRGDALPAGMATVQQLGADSGVSGNQAASAGGVFDSVLGEALGQAPTPADPADNPVRLSAVWLDVSVEVPGEGPTIQRRAIYDAIGPAARAAARIGAPVQAPVDDAAARLDRALALIREADIQVAAVATARDWVRQQMAHDGATLARMLAAASADQAAIPDLAAVPRMPVALHRYALTRFGTSAAVPDRPNVAIVWRGVAGSGSEDLRETLLYDIVANDAAMAAAAQPFAGRVAQGVRDTVTEAVLAGPDARANAAVQFEADLAAGRPWVRIEPGDIAAVDRLALPDDVRAAIAGDVGRGAIVVAPQIAAAAPLETGWWRVDWRTGTTLGVSLAGGAAQTEYALLVTQGIQVGTCAVTLGHAIQHNLVGLAGGAIVCAAGGLGGFAALYRGSAVIGATYSATSGAVGALMMAAAL
ncbi:MAG: hypothetical protein R3F55_18585 [Alphaproteobacteria bacterium]